MPQVTLRLPDELATALKQAAGAKGQSVNAYCISVFEALVNPDMAGDEYEQFRERLQRAGLLSEHSYRAPDPDPEKAEDALAALSKGTPLSEILREVR